MAQVAFSHQFSHRWTNAPLEIKNALIQEFDDIVCLLDEETDLETFEFTTPNLSQYIDSIYEQINEENQAMLEAKLATQGLSNDELEEKSSSASSQITDSESALKSDQNEAIETLDKPMVNQAVEISESTHAMDLLDGSHVTQNDNNQNIEKNRQLDRDVNSTSKTKGDETHTGDINETDAAAAHLTTKDLTTADTIKSDVISNIDLSNIELDESFIKELENRIDDYLTDQMTMISDDLKSWLREQISVKANHPKD